jgi:hypothetical protein
MTSRESPARHLPTPGRALTTGPLGRSPRGDEGVRTTSASRSRRCQPRARAVDLHEASAKFQAAAGRVRSSLPSRECFTELSRHSGPFQRIDRHRYSLGVPPCPRRRVTPISVGCSLLISVSRATLTFPPALRSVNHLTPTLIVSEDPLTSDGCRLGTIANTELCVELTQLGLDGVLTYVEVGAKLSVGHPSRKQG